MDYPHDIKYTPLDTPEAAVRRKLGLRMDLRTDKVLWSQGKKGIMTVTVVQVKKTSKVCESCNQPLLGEPAFEKIPYGKFYVKKLGKPGKDGHSWKVIGEMIKA